MDDLFLEVADDFPGLLTLREQRYRDAMAAQARNDSERERVARAQATPPPPPVNGGPGVTDPTTGRPMSAQAWWARRSA